MTDMKKTTETTKPKMKYEVGELPTEYAKVVYDTETEKPYEVLEAIAKIMNDVEEIKNTIIGK